MEARKLADPLLSVRLRTVYDGENGLRTLREVARSYQTIGKDLTGVMNRLKAVYRGWGIPPHRSMRSFNARPVQCR